MSKTSFVFRSRNDKATTVELGLQVNWQRYRMRRAIARVLSFTIALTCQRPWKETDCEEYTCFDVGPSWRTCRPDCCSESWRSCGGEDRLGRSAKTCRPQDGFDGHVNGLCEKFYKEGGRPSVPPPVYFRMLMIGYFEGLDSERGIAWRCADSLSLRHFLGYTLKEETPV